MEPYKSNIEFVPGNTNIESVSDKESRLCETISSDLFESDFVSEFNEPKENTNIIDQLKESRSQSKNDDELAPWEKYSLGFGTKMLHKMGYSGGGLGKFENGRVNPISVPDNKRGRGAVGFQSSSKENHNVTIERVENKVNLWPANTTLLIGDSILSGVK